MPITATEIEFRLSGGAGNSSTAASLGGIMSSTAITDATLHNLFDVVSSQEATDGDNEYRCIYVYNAHGTLTLQGAKIWISTNTPSTFTEVAIALAGEAVGVSVAETVGNESTAPTGPTFTTPASEGAALTIGDIPALSRKGIWIRRNVTGGAAAYNTDSAVLTVKGDTAA